jgi:gluconolactonase
MRYDIRPDDTLTNGKVFVDMSGVKASNGVPGGPDGFTVDREGNLYSGGPGGTWIISPSGKHIGTILLPASTTNVGFGGSDLKTLYLLDRRNVLKVHLNVAGVMPPSGTPYNITAKN